jgi:ribosomal protein L37AE/L43A
MKKPRIYRASNGIWVCEKDGAWAAGKDAENAYRHWDSIFGIMDRAIKGMFEADKELLRKL